MAEDERPEPGQDDGPSLELPSLRSAFRRRRPPARSRGTQAEHSPEPISAPTPDPVPEPALVPGPDLGPDLGPALSAEPVGLPEADPEARPTAVTPAPEPKRRRERRLVRVHLPGPVVALVTGAVAGLALVGLTAASLHLCTTMRGTSSCGRPGVLLLLLITVAVVLLGALPLRLLGVGPAGSTSFLGVGLLVVLILLALLPVADRWWMVVVVPVLAMLTYLAAWWLTTTYVEPGERAR
jgi:hypothetical protein